MRRWAWPMRWRDWWVPRSAVWCWAGLGGVVLADAVSFLAVVALLAAQVSGGGAAGPVQAAPGTAAGVAGGRAGGRYLPGGGGDDRGGVAAGRRAGADSRAERGIRPAGAGWVAGRCGAGAAVAVGTLAGGLVLAAVGAGTSPRRLSVLSLAGIAGFWAAVAALPAITTAIWVYLVLFALGGLPGVGAFIGVAEPGAKRCTARGAGPGLRAAGRVHDRGAGGRHAAGGRAR